jgi:indole-3-glycerol phosphate synthase
MGDFLDVLVRDAWETVRSGYYCVRDGNPAGPRVSLKESIVKCMRAPVIAEVKPASPSFGRLRRVTSIAEVAKALARGGIVGISVLTEPKHFSGSLNSLAEVKRHISLPVLMKDIIVDPLQVKAAARLGADAVLLIYSIFKKDRVDHTVEGMIQLSHSEGLETLLETHTREDFLAALKTDADLVGINNRNLKTLKVDLQTTKRILSGVDIHNKIVVSESGIQTVEDIRFLWSCGARAFLVGSTIMLAENVEEKVRELVMAI